MRQGELKICSICGTPKFKPTQDIENNRYGQFYCSRDCLKVGVSNRKHANKIAKEWS